MTAWLVGQNHLSQNMFNATWVAFELAPEYKFFEKNRDKCFHWLHWIPPWLTNTPSPVFYDCFHQSVPPNLLYSSSVLLVTILAGPSISYTWRNIFYWPILLFSSLFLYLWPFLFEHVPRTSPCRSITMEKNDWNGSIFDGTSHLAAPLPPFQ